MPVKRKRKVHVHRNSAVGAKKLGQKELEQASPREDLAISPDTSRNGHVTAKLDPLQPFQAAVEWDDLRLTAARLYGRGFRTSQIARALVEHLVPTNTAARTEEQKLSYARAKLRRWCNAQAFRDMIYQHAVVELDMEVPAIISGVAKSAKRGRVDAARLALELTGRHTKDDSAGATNVTVNLLNVARPE